MNSTVNGSQEKLLQKVLGIFEEEIHEKYLPGRPHV
jgi:hypothetical protein